MSSAKTLYQRLGFLDEEMSDGGGGDSDDESIANLTQKRIENSSKNKQKAVVSSNNNGDELVLAVKKKRLVVSLTPAKVLSDKGLLNLQDKFKRFKPTCLNSEGTLADLEHMMSIYESWAESLDVREGSHWPDFVEKLDRLKKVEIRRTIQQWREQGPPDKSKPPPFGASSSQTTQPVSRQMPSAPPVAPTLMAAPPALSEMTQDMKDKIQQKRDEALRRRQALLATTARSQSTSSSQIAPGSAPTSQALEGADVQITQPTQVLASGDSDQEPAMTASTQMLSQQDQAVDAASQSERDGNIDTSSQQDLCSAFPEDVASESRGNYEFDVAVAGTQLSQNLSSDDVDATTQGSQPGVAVVSSSGFVQAEATKETDDDNNEQAGAQDRATVEMPGPEVAHEEEDEL